MSVESGYLSIIILIRVSHIDIKRIKSFDNYFSSNGFVETLTTFILTILLSDPSFKIYLYFKASTHKGYLTLSTQQNNDPESNNCFIYSNLV